MEKKHDELLSMLKSCFLDILNEEYNLLHFDHVLEKMCKLISSKIMAKRVVFYYCSEWKDQLILDGINFEDSAFIQQYSFKTEPNAFADKLNMEVEEFVVQDGLRDLGLLKIIDPNKQLCSIYFIEKIGQVCGDFLRMVQNLSKMAVREKKYRLLFGVTEEFHSSIDMDEVLEDIIEVIQEVYPGFHYSLYLSQDNHTNSNLPIRGLQYNSENVVAMEAYVTGTVKIEDYLHETGSTLYAPLKGKQGVYGVLQITAPNVLVFPKKEVEFISVLANTAGNALENAQLYQQSKRLIADLKLINEVSHRLNSMQRYSDIVTFVCDQIITSFNAEEVGFILFNEGSNKTTILDGSTKFFQSRNSESYIQFFEEQLRKEKSPLFIGDFNIVIKGNYRSIMTIPMIQTGRMVGFIIVMHQQPNHFSFDSYKLLQSFILHSTLAFVNSTLREELERMVVTDYLTKLYTRNYLDQQIQKSMRDDAQGSFILIDIDNFKRVNDTYGHQVGDEILIQVAHVMNESIRDTDISARWGGEELAIYLPKVSMERGEAIANRVVEYVRSKTEPTVTVSCGVSHWTKKEVDSVVQLFNRADQALYHAKSSGKNRVVTQIEIEINE
ncbi:diguanylate cyclase domain-containing protein [Bacillus sp. T3]|uniref:sensor domain-containing diguanylate cyclase n=1 Tax=Bacillus sp. T3 TaxID=467262 RepID=UPI002982A686|nr:diguanylate cyclase [Bacillus sp. T3]